MQRRKLELQQLMNPPKTPQQMEFESQWKAEPLKPATSSTVPPIEPQKFKCLQPQPSTSKVLVPPQPSGPNDFASDVDIISFEDHLNIASTSKSYAGSQSQFNIQESDDPNGSSHNNVRNIKARPTAFSSSLGIVSANISATFPGLDVPLDEKSNLSEGHYENIADDDEDDCLPIDNSFVNDPPPIPAFRELARQAIMDMKDLLEPPGRTKRPAK